MSMLLLFSQMPLGQRSYRSRTICVFRQFGNENTRRTLYRWNEIAALINTWVEND